MHQASPRARVGSDSSKQKCYQNVFIAKQKPDIEDNLTGYSTLNQPIDVASLLPTQPLARGYSSTS